MKRLLFALPVLLFLLSAYANSGNAKGSPPEQAVIVYFDYGSADWKPFFAFEKTLEDAVNHSGAGDYDGNELAVDGSDGSLYMYGPDADKLFAVAKPILLSTRLLKNIKVVLRYGRVDDKSAREVTVRLGS